MTKKECIELYNALKGCKLTGMSTNGKMAALEALRKLRPVFESCDKDMETARESLKPEDFDEIVRKASDHNKAINGGTGERLDVDGLVRVSETINAYNKDVTDYEEKLIDEESGVDLPHMDSEDLERLVEANDLQADVLMVIYDKFKA